MSHELRTPLAAILGYAELLTEGIYGALPAKSTPIVARIHSNGTHLLGLINTVLDLSKIEAGQFTLSLSEYGLDNMVETVRAATESLAEAKKLAIKTDVAEAMPIGISDEQTPDSGPAQPGRQCHQVHGCRRGADKRGGARRAICGRGGRYGAWYPVAGAAQDL